MVKKSNWSKTRANGRADLGDDGAEPAGGGAVAEAREHVPHLLDPHVRVAAAGELGELGAELPDCAGDGAARRSNIIYLTEGLGAELPDCAGDGAARRASLSCVR